MYNFHKIITTLLIISFGILFSGCLSEEKVEKNIEHSVMIKDTDYKYFDTRMHFGEKATKEQIAGWDTDVRPDGKGLPVGEGSVAFGEEVYMAKCASCHGDFGEGNDRWPILSGGMGSIKNQRVDGNTEGPTKTIGSYWPYASTIFDYIKRAMPFTAPNSLTNNEVYALTAYLLMLNEIEVDGKEIDEDFVLSNKNFHKVKLPNEKNFHPQGDMKTPDRPDTQNTRCMSNCKEDFKVIEAIKGVTPLEPFKRRKLEPMKEKSSAKSMYDNTCAVCHAHGVADAPILGDKDSWASVIKQGSKMIYKNAIIGKGGMPPKGGNSSLSDKEVKAIVDYMIKMGK